MDIDDHHDVDIDDHRVLLLDVVIRVMTADRERQIAELRKAADMIARMTDAQWRRIASPAPAELRPFVVSDFIPLPSTLEDRL